MRTRITKTVLPESERETKERILDVAEQLFADYGVEGASLRRITKAANVNLAAVNYHFHSKERLIAAVFARRIEPLATEQSALLDALEQRAGNQPPPLDGVLRAIIEPAVIGESSWHHGHDTFRRLMGRMFAEPGSPLQLLVKAQFEKVSIRLDRLLADALPHLSSEELFWRKHFLYGALHHVLLISNRPELLAAPGLHPVFDAERIVQQLVAFTEAGFRVPPKTVNQDKENQ
jgi:AcrR family transcriptional regulator